MNMMQMLHANGLINNYRVLDQPVDLMAGNLIYYVMKRLFH